MLSKEHVKLFPSGMRAMYGLTKMQNTVLLFMLGHMDKSNVVTFDAASRSCLCDRQDIAHSTFDNAVTALVKKGFIERIGQHKFKFNRDYAGK